MARWLRIAMIVAVAGLLGSLPACSKKSGKMKIAIVTNCTHRFWDLCEAGAKKAAEKEGDVELLFRQPETGDPQLQKQAIEDWVNMGVSGIAVSVLNPDGQEEQLRNVSKQVNLITMDNDSPNCGRLCFIGVDNREAGRAVGRLVKKTIPNGGTIAVFIGNKTSQNAIDRPGGMLEELATPEANGVSGSHPLNPNLKGKYYGKYFLVDGEVKTDDMNEKVAESNADSMINRLDGLPDICLVGLYAYNPPNILKAYKGQKRVSQMKIVGFDEDLQTLASIAEGQIEGTVVQDPFNYGFQAVTILAAAAKGDKSKLLTKALPYRVVTKDGGPDQEINGLKIEFPKASDYETKVRDAFKSVGK